MPIQNYITYYTKNIVIKNSAQEFFKTEIGYNMLYFKENIIYIYIF